MPKQATTIETTHMVLGQSLDSLYIGFQPPLTPEQLDEVVVPIGDIDGHEAVFVPKVETHDDGSMRISFDPKLFNEPSAASKDGFERGPFVRYAQQVATSLGNVSLDETVRYIGPGSMFGISSLRD